MNRKREFILIAIITLLALLLRFYQLGAVPDGLYPDETSIGYNAYSILQTGKDEYGNSYPIYFKSFGDHKLPAYIYSTALSIKVFGLNAFAVRFPSALLGTLSVVFLIFILREINKNKVLPLLAGLLLAINPLHLHFSRAGFEVNMALFFALLGVWTFIKWIHTHRHFYLFISVLSFVLSLYSYNVTRLLSPLLFLALVILYRNTLQKMNTKYMVSVVIFGVLILLPFIISFFTRSGAESAKGALLTSTDIQANFLEFRSYLIGLPSIFTKVFFNQWIFLLFTYLTNLVSSLSPIFYFVSGSTHGNQGIGNVGVFYLFQFPLFLFGLISIIRDRVKPLYFFLTWLVITILVVSLSKEVPHATRGYFLIIPGTIFSAYGGHKLWQYLQEVKIKPFTYLLTLLFVGFSLYNVLFYLTSYYVRFPIFYAKSWRQQDESLVAYLTENAEKYDKIVFDTSSEFSYSSLLFYMPFPPVDFQKLVVREADDTEGFSRVLSFGKYEFRKIDWSVDMNSKEKTLFVTSSQNIPQDRAVVKTFTFPERPVVISNKETLLAFPVTDVVYILYESTAEEHFVPLH